MDTLQINNLLAKVPGYVGCFACNQIPHVSARPALFVVNTDPAELRGQHWVAIALLREGAGEYFDSFGLPPLQQEIAKYMAEQCAVWRYSPRVLQHPFAITCGLYACAFVRTRAAGQSYLSFLAHFGRDLDSNEKTIICLTQRLQLRVETRRDGSMRVQR